MSRLWIKIIGALAVVFIGVSAWQIGSYEKRILSHTYIGSIELGGLTQEQAVVIIENRLDELVANGIKVRVGDDEELISLAQIAFDMNVAEVISSAFSDGHNGSFLKQALERIFALFKVKNISVPVHLDKTALNATILAIAKVTNTEKRDIRLEIIGSKIKIRTDTSPGKVMNTDQVISDINDSLGQLDTNPVTVRLYDELPRANIATAPAALLSAERMMKSAITLTYEGTAVTISREQIGSWIMTAYDGSVILAKSDRDAIASYVPTIAKTINVDPVPPIIISSEGRITQFTPGRIGRAVQEDILINHIIKLLDERVSGSATTNNIVIPVRVSSLALSGLDTESGIRELIGKATTPFTGSPKNSVSNIKNGIKFLTGVVVPTGTEFSTLDTLGIIDNTTGYLPELVIKGDRTVPEYGGGLCQVSTTLFRTILDAGLPVTMRRNHSFRVSYYEKDGTGKFIGPGLDATIYEPDLDLRFLNDTGNPILILGTVSGDTATFEFYGTKDGRTSSIVGPTLLSETPSGNPIYHETTDLPVGTTKQIEVPHPGGHTIATYTVRYPDKTEKTQTFESWYRRWPAQYLVGVTAVTSPTPSPTATP